MIGLKVRVTDKTKLTILPAQRRRVAITLLPAMPGSGGLFAITGSGAGSVVIRGAGTGTITALPAINGSGAGVVSITGNGTGTITALPAINGSGAGTVRTSGTGTGTRLLAVSTGIIYDGDSNTDPVYGGGGNWPKIELTTCGFRPYLPVGGNFANAGATVQTMIDRQATVVAKVQEMVALTGGCIVRFQIGTNGAGGSMSTAQAITALAGYVQACRSAGAYVIANTVPIFNPPAGSFGAALNAAIVDRSIPVNDHVDVSALLTGTYPAGSTHYSQEDRRNVGIAGAAKLTALFTANDLYTDPIANLTVMPLDGTSGTLGTATTGSVPTGVTVGRNGGDGSCVVSIIEPGASASGRRTIRMVGTAGATATTVRLRVTVPFTIAVGDVIDAWATVEPKVTAGDNVKASLNLKNVSTGAVLGAFPLSLPTAQDRETWNSLAIWRIYPVNQPDTNTQFSYEFVFTIDPGDTATYEISGLAYVKRQSSASVAPQNTVAPVMSPAIVGNTLDCSTGTWTGTATITYAKQFYVNDNPVAANYVLQAGDAGLSAYCFVTATNSAGQGQAVSETVNVLVAAVNGSGAGTVSITGQGSGAVTSLAALSGSGSGLVSISGQGSGTVTGFAALDGSGAGTVSVAGSGTGAVVTPSAGTTWNSALVGSGGNPLVYTNDNHTVGRGGTTGSTFQQARALDGKSSGKWYAEFLIGTANTLIGLGDVNFGPAIAGQGTGPGSSGSGGNRITLTAAGACLDTGGPGNVPAATSRNVLNYANGDVMALAVDFDNKLLWFRKNGAGNWNGSFGGASADPATGVGGITFAGLVEELPLFLIAQLNISSASSITLCTDASGTNALNFSPPSGFSRWTA